MNSHTGKDGEKETASSTRVIGNSEYVVNVALTTG